MRKAKTPGQKRDRDRSKARVERWALEKHKVLVEREREARAAQCGREVLRLPARRKVVSDEAGKGTAGR